MATYELISETVASSTFANLTVDNIPDTYQDLIVYVTGGYNTNGAGTRCQIRFNDNTSAKYGYNNLVYNGTTVSYGASETAIRVGINDREFKDLGGILQLEIQNYASTTHWKPVWIQQWSHLNSVGTSYESQTVGNASFRDDTTAISKINFSFNDFMRAGTRVVIFGVV